KIEDADVRKRSRHEFSGCWRRGILSESVAPALRNATIAEGTTEHGMRSLRWSVMCAAALCAPLVAAAQQQPSDYAREKPWADESYTTLSFQMPILSAEAPPARYAVLFWEADARFAAAMTYLKGKRYERVVLLSHSMGSRMANHYVGVHPLVPLAGWISLSIS